MTNLLHDEDVDRQYYREMRDASDTKVSDETRAVKVHFYMERKRRFACRPIPRGRFMDNSTNPALVTCEKCLAYLVKMEGNAL